MKCESNNYSTNRAESRCDDGTKYNDDVSKYNHNLSVSAEGSHVVTQDVNKILEDLSSTPILKNTDNRMNGKIHMEQVNLQLI